MRYFSRRLSALLALSLLCCFCLTGCSDLHKVVYRNGEYTDETTNCVYVAQSSNYEPISKGDEYATLTLSGIRQTLYTITDLDPACWLTTEYNDIYTAKDVTLPDFAHWNTSELYICTNTKVSIAEVVLRNLTDVQTMLIDTICQEINEGETVSYAAVNCVDTEKTMLLRFASSEVPGIYYTLLYIECAESAYEGVTDAEGNTVDKDMGIYFVYDRPNNRCVAVSNILHYLLESGIPTATVSPESEE